MAKSDEEDVFDSLPMFGKIVVVALAGLVALIRMRTWGMI